MRPNWKFIEWQWCIHLLQFELGSLLCRFSNGVYHKPHHSCSLKCVFLLTENFSSSSWHSSADIRLLPLELQSRNSMRKIWTFSPLCMGRRSCKIAGRVV
ncbi:hypothetical protein H5410_042054 [Solanum commersonii]|uniref:Uncharacterized protein n=1 Tax=Solanum commersonii TaxID=4109 RepID=A0A9J5XWF1_SOLCO|nr:hypothetical protein H5410_042054 [Solanum commersonii]